MMDAVGPFVVVFIAGAGLALAQRRFEPAERSLLWLALAMHVGAALAQVWITVGVYGSGDMVLYHRIGGMVARWIEIDPDAAWPQTLRLLLRQSDARLPFDVIAPGETTGAMVAVGGLCRVAFGSSLYASCLALASLSFAGKVALYRAFREMFPAELRTRVLVGATMVPSMVFWTSGLLKEAVAVAGLGFLVLAIQQAATGRLRWAVPGLIFGGTAVAISKPYILFPLALAMAVYLYWKRAVARSGGRAVEIRPVALVGAIVLAVGGVSALGYVFPSYSIDGFAERAAYLQGMGARVDGGSNVEIGSATERTLIGQLAFAPLAFASALFRPFIFEVRNAPMAVSAIETSVIVLVVARVVVVERWARIWELTRSSPGLMMSVVFIGAFGVAVGLASTNLGTLSRYRVPMMPFVAAIALSWARNAHVTKEPARARRETVPVSS